MTESEAAVTESEAAMRKLQFRVEAKSMPRLRPDQDCASLTVSGAV